MNHVTLSDLPQDVSSLKLVHKWRSNETVSRCSFNPKAQTFEEFERNFQKKYHSVQMLPPQGIFLASKLVGVVYFERWFKDHELQISLFLDPDYIGKKIGSKTLQLALSQLKERGAQKVIALVQQSNLISMKLFQKGGFKTQGEVWVPKYDQKFKAVKFVYVFDAPRSTFVIAEAGSNCIQGSPKKTLELAKVMIEKAYEAGADAIKFQLFEDIYVPNAGSASYLNQDINSIFKDYALPRTILPELVDYATYVGIEWMCSFFSEDDFELINPYVKRHKIASYEIRHIRLIEKAAQSQKPLILSTGAATLEDISWALETFENNQGKDITLLQCTAQYPASAKGLNLRCIQQMRELFKKPVGLSDHSAHPLYAPIAAVTLGATVIEKHFTLSQDLPGPDHCFAVDCKSLKEMCTAIDETEKILGLAKKEIFPQEEELAAFARRGLQAIREIKQGESFAYGVNISILRPGMQRLGIHPKHVDEVEGKKAASNIPLGAGLKHEDIIW